MQLKEVTGFFSWPTELVFIDIAAIRVWRNINNLYDPYIIQIDNEILLVYELFTIIKFSLYLQPCITATKS